MADIEKGQLEFNEADRQILYRKNCILQALTTAASGLSPMKTRRTSACATSCLSGKNEVKNGNNSKAIAVSAMPIFLMSLRAA